MSLSDINSGVGDFTEFHLMGWVPTLEELDQLFDPMTATAADLSRMLEEGEISSVDTVKTYHLQILAHNGYLKAVSQLAPRAMDRAEMLDRLRAKGFILGPLHGIPVLINDNIGTDPDSGMSTTGGNVALRDSMTIRNAAIVDRLVVAGAIILGKTTLLQMMDFKGTGIRCGWSALFGQSQNPYVKGGINMADGLGGHSSPGGASSGSGISVAAGFAPIAIGIETAGSLVSPATRQSLYTIKPTYCPGANAGIMPISYNLDVAGPMCKSVEDVSIVLTVLKGYNKDHIAFKDYTAVMKGAFGWSKLRVGMLNPEKFRYNESFQLNVPEATEQMLSATMDGYDRIKSLAKEYHYDVSLKLDSGFDFEGSDSLLEWMIIDFATDFDLYLRDTLGSLVLSTRDLVSWNVENAVVELPNEYPHQDLMVRSAAFDVSSGRKAKFVHHAAGVGRNFLHTLYNHGIDVIIGPSDSNFCKFATSTGLPMCSLPLGYIAYNGRPIGLTAIAENETILVTLMSAFEDTFPERVPPSAFLERET